MLEDRLIDPDLILINEMTRSVIATFAHVYGRDFPQASEVGRMKEILETCVSQSGGIISAGIDIPYHDLRHTFDVVMAMQEILYGKTTVETVSPEDWFLSMIAAVNHDIGYVPGLFPDDELSAETTGATLTAEHVPRSMRFVRERFKNSGAVDAATIAERIRFTGVPVPEDTLDQNGTYGGLLRAADYIGQFANINIRKKNNALLYEFKEVGIAEKFGYENVGDVIRAFPGFFTNAVEPLLHPAIEFLQRFPRGVLMVNSMYGVVKQCELYAEKHLPTGSEVPEQ